MFHNAYVCPWCFKDLKSKEIPSSVKPYYHSEDTHYTSAIELWGKGWEHEDCSCRWDSNKEIFKEGLVEFKDKYKIEELETKIENSNDSEVVSKNITTENDNEESLDKENKKTN